MTKTNEEIIECGGIYEVHAGANGGWAVVNSATGEVVANYTTRTAAIGAAKTCNSR